jgi:hypothetical protein
VAELIDLGKHLISLTISISNEFWPITRKEGRYSFSFFKSQAVYLHLLTTLSVIQLLVQQKKM